MPRFLCFRAIPLLPVMLASAFTACTFNIASRTVDLEETSEVPFNTMHLALTDEAPGLQSAAVVVVGSGRRDALVRAHLAALRSPGESIDVLSTGWNLLLGLREENVLDLNVMPPPGTDVWLEELSLDLPAATALALAVEGHSLDISAMQGRIEAEATSGSMNVESTASVNLRSTSGSIVVHASEGTIAGDSGSVDFNLDGWAHATTTSGSVVGRLGDGGAIETTSGSIDLSLTRPLTRDLTVQSRSGSIDISVPSMPCTLVVRSDHGDVSIRIGTLVEHARNVRVDIAGGGPLLQVTNTSGSIAIIGR